MASEGNKKKMVAWLRHMATHYDLYECVYVYDNSLKGLKKEFLECYEMPESTARYHIKTVVDGDCGLLRYDRDKDSISIDKERVREFFEELGYMIGFDEFGPTNEWCCACERREKSKDNERMDEMEKDDPSESEN